MKEIKTTKTDMRMKAKYTLSLLQIVAMMN
jgi:hypothetical protein